MNRIRRTSAAAAAFAAMSASILTGCSSGTSPATVPSLGHTTVHGRASGPAPGGSSSSTAPRPRVGYSSTRVAQLHAAAQCIREHGVPDYQDPVLTADGQVYTDARSIQDAANAASGQSDAFYNTLRQACGHLLAVAGFQGDDESPAPPQLVQAGVRSAECLRAHGMPNMADPTAQTPFTPGHGFALTASDLPNGGALGKQDPVLQRAFSACRSQLDSEIRASSLGSLGHD